MPPARQPDEQLEPDTENTKRNLVHTFERNESILDLRRAPHKYPILCLELLDDFSYKLIQLIYPRLLGLNL